LRDTDTNITGSNKNALLKIPQSNLATRGKAAIELLQLPYVIFSQPAFKHLVDDPRHRDFLELYALQSVCRSQTILAGKPGIDFLHEIATAVAIEQVPRCKPLGPTPFIRRDLWPVAPHGNFAQGTDVCHFLQVIADQPRWS